MFCNQYVLQNTSDEDRISCVDVTRRVTLYKTLLTTSMLIFVTSNEEISIYGSHMYFSFLKALVNAEHCEIQG
jgi:hypothetical protein